MRVLSLGAGVQSSTLLLMAVHGELEVDRAIFADTGWEPAAVYEWLEVLVPIAERAGIPVDVVTGGNLREDAISHAQAEKAWLPLHILNQQGQPGMLRRQCTANYKIRPIKRRLRELGATAKQPITQIIGISLDEFGRMRDPDVRYIRHEYPLVDRRMTRLACVGWLARHGYPEPPKSSCLGCPYKSDRQWRALKVASPDEWQQTVEFDQVVRHARAAFTGAYVHRSLKPLDQVDLSTPQDAGQLEMFGGECDGFTCMATGEIG